MVDYLRESRQVLKAVNPEIAFYMNGGVRGGNWATARLNRELIAEQDILGSEGGVTTHPPALFHLRNGVLANEEYRNLRPRNTYEAQAGAFLAAVRGEREPWVTEEETLNVQRILRWWARCRRCR